MALLTPFNKMPELNTANILLVENEEQFQTKLADVIVNYEKQINVNVRLARKLPLPIENADTRPRIDLVVFIVNLIYERSLQAMESSIKHLDSGFFVGKVCFLVTGARCGSVSHERLLSVRKLAASLHCPMLCAEDQTTEGVRAAALRLLSIVKVSAGLVPTATALYLSALTRCTLPAELDQD
ncbi:centromere protein M [Chanos chanos]|uniref:Centromere protein M n=1 Tax=Chanos chanos TaxID=29144 RepID=A0A6J2VVC2_CHACN|nr:centromere protein M [Chanos chanos]